MDCAAKFQGRSLNDCLYQGSDKIANLTGVLLRFRREPVAVAVDISEMFMQVKVPEKTEICYEFCGRRQTIFLIDPKNFV